MIRDVKELDIDRIMELWLDTNSSTHSFIACEYWKNNYDTVKAMMPNTTIYVYEENNVIQGFIGLIDHYIAGIFVFQHLQSKGIGKQLLDYAKDKKDILTLSVYQKNTGAIRFYLREDFTFSKEQMDKNTGEIEWSMHWST